MNPQSLIGYWLLLGSEVKTLKPKSEIFHFKDNGRFEMLYTDGIGGFVKNKYFYTIASDTILWGYRHDLSSFMKAELDESTLIILGNHGMESYFQKLTLENAPDWCNFVEV